MTHNRIGINITVGTLLAWVTGLASASLAVVIGLDVIPARWGFVAVVLAVAALGLTVDRLFERQAQRELGAFNLGREAGLRIIGRD